jgi:hypothetical protein
MPTIFVHNSLISLFKISSYPETNKKRGINYSFERLKGFFITFVNGILLLLFAVPSKHVAGEPTSAHQRANNA